MPNRRGRGWRGGLAGRAWALLVLLALAFCPATAPAQPRVALVVGVAAYQAVPALANPANDAADIGAALGRLGFQTEVVIDPDRAVLEQAVRRFGARARGADAALFFYAGHAVEAAGRNWLLPRTADITSDRDLRFEALDADGVLEQVEGAARVTIVLLDACRDNPFRGRMASGGTRSAGAPGLAPVRAAVGTLIAFATAPGTVAEDGRGRNSPFTTALLKHLEAPGVELRQIMAEVRRDVRETTGGRQVPWEHSSLEGAFYFRPPAPPSAPAAAPRAPATDPEMLFWESIRSGQDPADFRAYLERFPQGTFAPLARNRLAQLGSAAAPRPASVAEPLTEQALAAAIPFMTPEGARSIARLFVAARPLRALAVNPERRASWRFENLSPANEARAEEIVLERCQLGHGSPCVLVAVNDRLQGPGPNGAWTPRDMPLLRQAGAYDPDRLPGATAERRAQPGLRDYGSAAAPKAIALHPAGGSYFWTTGAASQRAAEEDALHRCNTDPVRAGRDGACFLYAVGNAVVLPERRTEPRTGASDNPPPPAMAAAPRPVASAAPTPAVAATAATGSAPTITSSPAARPPSAPGASTSATTPVAAPAAMTPAAAITLPPAARAFETRLLAALAHGAAPNAPVPAWRPDAVAHYIAAAESKALAVEPVGGGLYRRTRRPAAAEAEQLALEGCALHYGRPCAVLAVDGELRAPDPRAAPRREMPRLRRTGAFVPEEVPMTSANYMPSVVAGYAARPAPKAMVLSASPPAFFVRGGATTAEAEAAALADCAAAPTDGGFPPRCRVYALDDRVVITEGRPRPAAPAGRPAAAPR